MFFFKYSFRFASRFCFFFVDIHHIRKVHGRYHVVTRVLPTHVSDVIWILRWK